MHIYISLCFAHGIHRKILEEKEIALEEYSSMKHRMVDISTRINSVLNIDLCSSMSVASMDTLSNLATKVRNY